MKPVLQAREVSFRYPQNQHVVGSFSLCLQPGESLLINGQSGSGKSTLARCLIGIIPHLYHGDLRGEVWLNGLRTDQAPMWALAEQAGFVFQNPALQMIAPTVEEEILFGLENLGLARSEMRQRLEEVLEKFRFESFRTRSPQSLSGGEQQKLALAAVLARRPALLMLDEPLSMLDTTSAFHLVDLLADQARAGVTTVISEHRDAYLKQFPGLRVETLNGSHPLDLHSSSWQGPAVTTVETLVVDHLLVQRGSRRIIDDLSFSLRSGQIVALVGPNGVGKTTLFRTLAGFQPYEGKILLAERGEPPRFGMVFQNPDVQLFNATVREEILYQVAQPDRKWYRWLLEMLDLERYEATPPLLLSEGEKRRVALATVLMRRPGSGILLDEPALGLDSVHRAILLRLLRALADQGQFILFSTHDLELAAQADHLLLLGQNGIVAEGSAGETLRDKSAWERLGLVCPDWVNIPGGGSQ